MPDIKDSLSDITKLGPWTNVGLECGNAEINGPSLDLLIAWVKQMKGSGDASYFRIVFSRPGITMQLEGKLEGAPATDAIKKQQEDRVHGAGQLKLVRPEVTKKG